MFTRQVGIGAIVVAVLALSACSSGSNPSAGPSSGSDSAGSSHAAASSGTPGSSGATSAATSASATKTGPASTTATASGSAGSGPADGPVPAGFRPYSTTFISTQDGWALGTAPCTHKPCGSVVRTTDGGRSWHGVPAPKATVIGYQSLPVGGAWLLRFADQNDGWAAGRGLYATHDGGRTWHKVAVGPAAGTVTSIGTGGGYVYATVYGCPPSGDGTCSKTSAVYAATISSDRWAAVSSTFHDSSQTAPLVVHGSDWYAATDTSILHGHGSSRASALPNPCPVSLGNRDAPTMAAADTQHLDAVCSGEGAAGSASFQLFGTTDGGRHWAKAGGSHREDSNLTGVADNGHGVFLMAVASGNSALLRSTNDGTTLTNAAVSAPVGGTPWADLGFTTASQAVVVLAGSGLYFSHDAGRTWARTTF